MSKTTTLIAYPEYVQYLLDKAHEYNLEDDHPADARYIIGQLCKVVKNLLEDNSHP